MHCNDFLFHPLTAQRQLITVKSMYHQYSFVSILACDISYEYFQDTRTLVVPERLNKRDSTT